SNVGQVWLGEARDAYTGRRRGYLYDLFVEPALRGQGIARALLAAAEAASRARGDRELCLTVAWQNERARSLYEAFGFETERLTLIKPLEA
ncbi:MAG: GNAT family N-acetyltransferase, partial [Ardenticatenales bacterium]|nr:GNAT family N-acetyltransferase [Ardenticatenales bacterium]